MMEAHRKLFLEGAVKNNHDPQKAEELFDLMEKFGGYGFNKSHSAAYALIAFQTAFLKANYTLEFIAALMTSERGNTDAVLKYMDECRTHDIQVLRRMSMIVNPSSLWSKTGSGSGWPQSRGWEMLPLT